MNFAKLYIGDYLRDTGTLTLAQHGAYMLMLLEFYATERPLPTGRDLHRLLRAETKIEREAIDFVAGKFWQSEEAGLVNQRGMKEIERAAHQRSVNQSIGKLGGRPKRTEPITDSVSVSEPNRNPNHSQTKNVSDEPNGSSSSPGATAKPRSTVPCPYADIVAAYHDLLPTLPRCRLMPAARQKALRRVWGWVLSSRRADESRRAVSADEAMAWIRDYFGRDFASYAPGVMATNADEALAWLSGYFRRASENDFLMGRSGRSAEHADWQCDLDFLLTDRGMKRVIEHTKDVAA